MFAATTPGMRYRRRVISAPATRAARWTGFMLGRRACGMKDEENLHLKACHACFQRTDSSVVTHSIF